MNNAILNNAIELATKAAMAESIESAALEEAIEAARAALASHLSELADPADVSFDAVCAAMDTWRKNKQA